MPSAVDIANMALLRVGAEPIVSLSDDNNRARACNLAWPFVRQDVLRQHSWNCATIRATLPASATAPAWEFTARYSLPNDCLHVLEVDVTDDWRVENGFIVTLGSGDLNIRYIKDETDTEKYDPALVAVMYLRLAVEISSRINQSVRSKQLLLEEYLTALNEAMVADGQEQSPAEFEEAGWLKARYGWSS